MTTLLIPAGAFAEGGPANGRALAYLAHEHLGEAFGTLYDISTVAILWFAGASAMVGLLNLVPRYLPRYGMAPEWAKAHRPLVLLFTVVAFVVTVLFKADVDAQGGAYATGVLVLMGSAALAVTLAARRTGRAWLGFALLTLIFVYTTSSTSSSVPKASRSRRIFIVSIVGQLDGLARAAIDGAADPCRRARRGSATLHARSGRRAASVSSPTGPTRATSRSTRASCTRPRDATICTPDERVMFLEVRPGDASAFSDRLCVQGVEVGRHRVLRCVSPAIPNAIAALLLYCPRRDRHDPARATSAGPKAIPSRIC